MSFHSDHLLLEQILLQIYLLFVSFHSEPILLQIPQVSLKSFFDALMLSSAGDKIEVVHCTPEKDRALFH